MIRIIIVILGIFIACSNQKNQIKNPTDYKELLNKFHGSWFIDYENTVKALLIKNKFDPEIDVDIYENFLNQIKKDIPNAMIRIEQRGESNLWQFQYTKKENHKTITKNHQGTFQILEFKDNKLVLELTEAEIKETLLLEIINQNKLKMSMYYSNQKDFDNEIYFIKNEDS